MKPMTEQAKKIRDARKVLKMTNPELAEELGVSLPTLRSWLMPKGDPEKTSYRNMPRTAKLLLDRILAEHRKKGKN